MDKTTLGNRMKTYEATTQSKLLRRTPVIIRVDGKAFHTWTKKIKPSIDPTLNESPFSKVMHDLMVSTALSMCSQMQNAELAYTQSDEISILLRDWDKHETEQWFDAKIQKIVSVSAAMAATYFNYYLQRLPIWPQTDYDDKGCLDPLPSWIGDIPLFDSRVFNLPMEEVTNYFIWRQQDASRNSVQMLGRYYFSAKQMHGKSNNDVQDMLMELEKPVNWNNIATWMKRGTCIIPNPNSFDSSAAYVVDEEIPIFTQDRNYVERHLVPEKDWDEMIAESHQALDNIQAAGNEMLIKKGGPYDAEEQMKSR